MTAPLAGEIVKVSDIGIELAYAEITTPTAEITAQVDVGPSITFTLTETRIVRIIGSFLLRSSSANDTMRSVIVDGSGVQIMDGGTHLIVGAATNNRNEFSRRLSLVAGTYTYKLQAQSTASAGTTVVSASTTNPTYIQALDLGAG